MNIKQLRVFVEVCNQGSFTKAANQLYMTQQAVSHSISVLERSINCTLFYRSANNLKLTDDGNFLYKNCQALLHEDDLLEYKMTHRNQSTEEIHFGYGFGMLRNFPRDFFMPFQKKYPHYRLVGSEMLNKTCEHLLETGSLDICLTIGPVDESQFTSFPIFRDRYVGIMEKDNPLSQKKLLNINDLRGQGIICNSGKNRDSLIECCEKCGFQPNIIHCSTDLISQMYLCHQSPYIVVTVDQLLENMFHQYPSLCKVAFDDSIYPWEMCLITKKNKKNSRAITMFINYILENLPDN